MEQIGIERSMKALEEAELILIVLDASRPQDDEDRRLLDLTEGRNRIVVINKKGSRAAGGGSFRYDFHLCRSESD